MSSSLALGRTLRLDTRRLELLPSLLFPALALGLVQLGHLFLVHLALLLFLLVPFVNLVLAQSLNLLQQGNGTLLLGLHDDGTLLQVRRIALRRGHLGLCSIRQGGLDLSWDLEGVEASCRSFDRLGRRLAQVENTRNGPTLYVESAFIGVFNASSLLTWPVSRMPCQADLSDSSKDVTGLYSLRGSIEYHARKNTMSIFRDQPRPS
jgi:hypothetical protein